MKKVLILALILMGVMATKAQAQFVPLTQGNNFAVVQGGPTAYPITVGGITTVTSVTPTITAGSYTTGKVIGGLITLSAGKTPGAATGIIHDVLISDLSNQKAPIDVFFFNANPTSSTLTDGSTFTVNAADITKFAGVCSILATDWVSDSAHGFTNKLNQGIAFGSGGTGTIYAVMVIRGSATFSGTGDLTLKIKVLQD